MHRALSQGTNFKFKSFHKKKTYLIQATKVGIQISTVVKKFSNRTKVFFTKSHQARFFSFFPESTFTRKQQMGNLIISSLQEEVLLGRSRRQKTKQHQHTNYKVWRRGKQQRQRFSIALGKINVFFHCLLLVLLLLVLHRCEKI